MMIETSCIDCEPTTRETNANQDRRQFVVQPPNTDQSAPPSQPPPSPPSVNHQLKPNTLIKASSARSSNQQQHNYHYSPAGALNSLNRHSPLLAPQLLLSSGGNSNGGVASHHHQLLNLTNHLTSQSSVGGHHQFNHLTPDARACVTATYLCVLIVNNTWLDCNLLETLCNNSSSSSSSSSNNSGDNSFKNKQHDQADGGDQSSKWPNHDDKQQQQHLDFGSAEAALESALSGLVAITGGGGGQTEEDEGGGDHGGHRLHHLQYHHHHHQQQQQQPPGLLLSKPIMIDLMQAAEPDKSRPLPVEPHDKGGGGEDGGGGGGDNLGWLVGGQSSALGEPSGALSVAPDKVGRLVEQIRLINLRRVQQQAQLGGNGYTESQGPRQQQHHPAIQVRHMFGGDISQSNDNETGHHSVDGFHAGDTTATTTTDAQEAPSGQQQQQGSSSSSFISWIGRPFRGWGSYSFWPIISTSSPTPTTTSTSQQPDELPATSEQSTTTSTPTTTTTSTTLATTGGSRQQQQQQQLSLQDNLVLQIPEPARQMQTQMQMQMQILRPIDRSEQYNDISTNQSLQPYKFNLSNSNNNYRQPPPIGGAEEFSDVHQFQLGPATTTAATTATSQDYLVSEASQTTASRSPFHQVRPTSPGASPSGGGNNNNNQLIQSLLASSGMAPPHAGSSYLNQQQQQQRGRPILSNGGCRCDHQRGDEMLATMMAGASDEDEDEDEGTPFNCRLYCATATTLASSISSPATTMSSGPSGQQQQLVASVTTQPSVLSTLNDDQVDSGPDSSDSDDSDDGGGEPASSPGGGQHQQHQNLATSSSFTAATSTTMMPNAKMNPLDVVFLLYTRYHRDLIRGVGVGVDGPGGPAHHLLSLDSVVGLGHTGQQQQQQPQRASGTSNTSGQAAGQGGDRTKHLISVSEIIDLNNETSLAESHLNSSLPIKIVIHGFGSGGRRPWVQDMVLKLLDYEDVNVIVVDWEKGATMPNYVQAAGNTRLVGHKIAALIKWINAKFGLTGNSFHLIGFSLGAHVAGFAGMEIRNCTSVPRHWINRITGLDPASPLFEGYEANDRLDPSDAQFVDVIHSNGDGVLRGGFGSLQPMGHVDFYPNGGRVQVGCNSVIISALSDIIYGKWQSLCNHRRALNFFMDSFEFNKCRFRSFSCDSYESYLRGDCFDCGQNNEKCSYMGYLANYSKGRGKMYLTTHEEAPFCANQFIIKIIGSKGYKTHWGKVEVTLVTLDGKNESFLLSSINDNRQSSSSGGGSGISLGGGGGGSSSGGGGGGTGSGTGGSSSGGGGGGSGSGSNERGGDHSSSGGGGGGNGGGSGVASGSVASGQRELLTQHSMQSLIVAHPTLINFTHVLLRYTKYKGWIYSGDESWPIDKVFITDSDGQVKSFCGFNTVLESHITTRLNLEPGNCTVIEPPPAGVAGPLGLGGMGAPSASIAAAAAAAGGLGPSLVVGGRAATGQSAPNGLTLAQEQQQQQQTQPLQSPRQPRLFGSIMGAGGQQLDSATQGPPTHLGGHPHLHHLAHHHHHGLHYLNNNNNNNNNGGGHFQRMGGGGGSVFGAPGGAQNQMGHQILAF